MEPMARLALFSPISVSWIDMQWDTQIERMESGRIHQVSSGQTFTTKESQEPEPNQGYLQYDPGEDGR